MNKCWTVNAGVNSIFVEFVLIFPWKVNAVNCNTSWKISLFLAYEDNSEEVLKGVSAFDR